MTFFNLSNEITIEIVENLNKEQDIYSLIRVSRRFYNLFDDYLYCHNIKHRRCSALFWTAKHDRESTERKMLYQEADVNFKVQKTRSHESESRADLTSLHLTTKKSHLVMMKLLLEVEANSEVKVQESLTLLFFALIARHEKIARTISRRTSNLQNCLMNSTKDLTLLHVSCYRGLWRCARYFLNEDADVDAINARTMSFLHHALLQDSSSSESDCDFTISTIDIDEEDSSLCSDEILAIAKILMKFEANQNLESRPRSIWEKLISAREYEVNHSYDQVRAFFFDRADDSLSHIYKNKFHSSHIGRTWMLLSLSEMSETNCDELNRMKHINIEHFFNNHHSVRTSDEDQKRQANLDLNSFSVFNDVNKSHISSLKTHVSDNSWSFSNIHSLILSFSVVNELDTSSIIEQSAQVNFFSQLNDHIFKVPLATKASKLWADFEKSKGHLVTEEVFSSSANDEKSSSETKRKKVRDKNRWQSLKL